MTDHSDGPRTWPSLLQLWQLPGMPGTGRWWFSKKKHGKKTWKILAVYPVNKHNYGKSPCYSWVNQLFRLAQFQWLFVCLPEGNRCHFFEIALLNWYTGKNITEIHLKFMDFGVIQKIWEFLLGNDFGFGGVQTVDWAKVEYHRFKKHILLVPNCWFS